MDPVHDEAGGQAIFRELFPDVVGMAREHGVGSVAQMRRKRGSGADRVANLLRGRPSVADAGHDPLAGKLVDIARRIGPFGGKGHQADVAAWPLSPEWPDAT